MGAFSYFLHLKIMFLYMDFGFITSIFGIRTSSRVVCFGSASIHCSNQYLQPLCVPLCGCLRISFFVWRRWYLVPQLPALFMMDTNFSIEKRKLL